MVGWWLGRVYQFGGPQAEKVNYRVLPAALTYFHLLPTQPFAFTHKEIYTFKRFFVFFVKFLPP